MKLLLRFPDLEQDLRGVAVRVYLEDLSEAGGPAVRIAAFDFDPVEVQRARPELELQIEPPHVPRGAQASLRIHVDADRSGSVSVGDYVSTAVQPLAPDTQPGSTRTIEVARVG